MRMPPLRTSLNSTLYNVMYMPVQFLKFNIIIAYFNEIE